VRETSKQSLVAVWHEIREGGRYPPVSTGLLKRKKKDLNLRKVFQYFYFACEIIFRIKIDNYFVTVIFDIILEKTSLL
jgi:hypothetical protein